MTKVKFFICKHCGNIVGVIQDSGVPMVCCGENMHELVANTSDGAFEKHVPVVSVEKTKDGYEIIKAKVGSVEHPMIPEHYIEWVCIQTKQGSQMKQLQPGQAPKVCFSICECDEVEAVYAYCNLHSLWVAK